MKRFYMLMMLLGLVGWMTGTAQATVYTFSPNPSDLNDLPHQNAYLWGINGNSTQNGGNLYSQLNAGYTITGATLTFSHIYDWQVESNDQLFLTLLDTPAALGVTTYSNESPTVGGNNVNNGNYFNPAGQNSVPAMPNPADYFDTHATASTYLGYWNDPATSVNTNGVTLTYDFLSATHSPFAGGVSGSLASVLAAYILNGQTFGIGFDPECHYYNSGITLTITTTNIPQEPSVPEPATLTLCGLGLGLSGLVRRLRKA